MSEKPLITSIQLQEIADVIGAEAAVRLAQVYGGQERVYVPRTPRRDHPMVNVVGWEAFVKLCERYARERIVIPRNAVADSLKQRILELDGQANRMEIARQLGCTERYVRMVLNDGKDTDQGDLFG